MSEKPYVVNIHARIDDLLAEWDRDLGPNDHLVYEWIGGAERVYQEFESGATSEYRGVYHPNNGVCEPTPFFEGASRDAFVCHWCGSVCW